VSPVRRPHRPGLAAAGARPLGPAAVPCSARGVGVSAASAPHRRQPQHGAC
jgi:hypothetical protein